MHVYLAAACPQCRSTTMVVTNRDYAWGRDHAINCGACGRQVIASGLTGKGLQWHGSIDPEVWGNKLWDFAKEGVDSVTMATPSPRRQGQEGDLRRGESRVLAAAAVVHYAPGDSPLCGLEESPEPIVAGASARGISGDTAQEQPEGKAGRPRPGAGAGMRRLP